MRSDVQSQTLLDPELLMSVQGLELIAKILVEGFMTGSNKSISTGAGQEFSQYRNYQSGDDLRQLDWKMYARSERYFVKQSEIETNITVKFMMDASRSMAYAESGLTKLSYAKMMTAAMAYVAKNQSDTIGLYAVNDKHVSVVTPRFEQQQFHRFLNALMNVQSEGGWSEGGNLQEHRGKELIVFISDLYDRDDDLLSFINRLKTTRNEVIVFHVMGRKELTLDVGNNRTIEDLETGARIDISAAEKAAYTDRVTAWLAQTRTWMLERHINYQLVMMDQSPGYELRNFLEHRKKLLR